MLTVCSVCVPVPVTVTVYAPAVVPARVVTVSVEFSAVVPLMFTEVGVSKQVGRSAAPVGPVTAQLNATLPANPFVGVTVSVEVGAPPAVAPSFARPVSVKLGVAATGSVSVTDSVVPPETPVTTTL